MSFFCSETFKVSKGGGNGRQTLVNAIIVLRRCSSVFSPLFCYYRRLMYVLQKITFQQGVHSSLDPYVVTSCLHVESWQPGDFKISGKERRREGSNLGQGRNKLIKPSKDACLQPCQKSEEENCFIYLHPFDSRCAPPRKKTRISCPTFFFRLNFFIERRLLLLHALARFTHHSTPRGLQKS